MLLIFMRKPISTPALFPEILQRYYKLLFWVLWVHPTNTMASTGRKLLCLSVNKKSTWSLHVFYRYYTLQDPAICDWPRKFWKIALEQKFYRTWTFSLFLHLHVEHLVLSSFPCFHIFLSILLSGILILSSWV